MDELKGMRVGFIMCGSFCSFEKAFSAMENLVSLGAEVHPVMSYNAAHLDTKFGFAKDHRERAESISGRAPILTITAAEPIGPRRLWDVAAVVPCTGNTLSKIAAGITDTPAAMAVKSHLRVGGPVVLAPFTNDGLSGSAPAIGKLMARKNIFFLPLFQDDPEAKPTSLACDLGQLPMALLAAKEGIQLQPMLKK